MNDLEKVQRYIERTNIPRKDWYDMRFNEWRSIARLEGGVMEAVSLAFEYGRAKGYRAGKAAA